MSRPPPKQTHTTQVQATQGAHNEGAAEEVSVPDQVSVCRG